MSYTELFKEHFVSLQSSLDRLLEQHGFDLLLAYSGSIRYRHRDDIPLPFHANAIFKALVPLDDRPDCWVLWPRGEKPELIFCSPAGPWDLEPDLNDTDWSDYFHVRVIRRAEEAARYLAAAGAGACVCAGEFEPWLDSWELGERNPPAMLAALDWMRSFKTPYEQSCLRAANRISATGHLAARDAFAAGASEFEIIQAFLGATAQGEPHLPYPPVVGINRHAAALHYGGRDCHRFPHGARRSLLIDAGNWYRGYAADVTRTYCIGGGLFSEMIEALDAAQQALVLALGQCTSYPEIELRAQKAVATILVDLGVLRSNGDAAIEKGLVQAFMPHGFGHFLGLQVHDVGASQRSPNGEDVPPDPRYPPGRMRRMIEPGQAVTVEPGIYFIDSLLADVAASPHSACLDWDRVETLRRFGGLRIEDNVIVHEYGIENLTRDAFAGVSQSVGDRFSMGVTAEVKLPEKARNERFNF